jgi:hypothetical protein
MLRFPGIDSEIASIVAEHPGVRFVEGIIEDAFMEIPPYGNKTFVVFFDEPKKKLLRQEFTICVPMVKPGSGISAHFEFPWP